MLHASATNSGLPWPTAWPQPILPSDVAHFFNRRRKQDSERHPFRCKRDAAGLQSRDGRIHDFTIMPSASDNL